MTRCFPAGVESRAPPIRVLLADDHTLFREGISAILARHGLQVVGEASDGDEAVEMTKRLMPDVVLMDIAMPRVNGIEATRRIKKSSPGTVVLALTMYDDDEYLFAVLEAGAAGYLLKNAHGGELATAVRAVHAGESVLSPAVAHKVMAKFVATHGSDGQRAGTPLTGRELATLKLAARGLPNKLIANELSISPRTVQEHLANIFDKLDVASRTEAVITGLKRGWIRLEELD